VAGVPAILQAEAFEAAGITFTETSLQIANPEGLSRDAYLRLGAFLATIGRGYCFWVGDLLNSAEDNIEEWAQLEAILPHSPHTLVNYKSVASRIPRTRRRKMLSFSTHAEVAYLDPRVRDQWLDKAERYDWKREDMRAALNDAGLKPKSSGSVGNEALTSKSDPLGRAGLDREERLGANEAPALGRRGELVPSPKICPHCGHVLEEE
jgi:hypothetical protein